MRCEVGCIKWDQEDRDSVSMLAHVPPELDTAWPKRPSAAWGRCVIFAEQAQLSAAKWPPCTISSGPSSEAPKGAFELREGEGVGVADLVASRRCQSSRGRGATGLFGARAPVLSADPGFVATPCGRAPRDGVLPGPDRAVSAGRALQPV